MMDDAISRAEREATDASASAARARKQLREWTDGEKAVIRSLKRIGEIITSPDFVATSARFVDAHKDEFDFVEENRLEWTALHEQYVELMDQAISSRAEGVDMDELMANLPEFVKGGAQEQDPEQTGATMDFLFSLTEFDTFKNMMLAAKLQGQRASNAHSENFDSVASDASTSLGGISDLAMPEAVLRRAERLLAVNGDGADWKTLAEKPGEYKLEGTSQGGDRFVRNTITFADATPAELVDCHVDHSNAPERDGWDKMWTGTEVLRAQDTPHGKDQLVRMGLKLPGVVKFMPVPKQICMRICTQNDHPHPNWTTAVMTTWDEVKDCPDTGRMAMVRLIVVSPGESGRGSRMLNVGKMPPVMPEWLQPIFFTNTINKEAQLAVQRYKQMKGKTRQ